MAGAAVPNDWTVASLYAAVFPGIVPSPDPLPVPAPPPPPPVVLKPEPRCVMERVNTMYKACSDGDCALVKSCFHNYPCHLHGSTMYQYVVRFQLNPIYVAAVHGHVDVVKLLGHDWRRVSVGVNSGKTRGGVNQSVFAMLLRAHVLTPAVCLALVGCRGGKLTYKCRLTSAGVAVVETDRREILDFMQRTKLFSNDKHYIYRSALVCASRVHNYNALFRLLSYPERATVTSRTVNKCVDAMFTGIANGAQYEYSIATRSSILRCLFVFKEKNLEMTKSRLNSAPTMYREFHRYTFDDAAIKLALGWKDRIMIHFATIDTPVNFSYHERRNLVEHKLRYLPFKPLNGVHIPFLDMWSIKTHEYMTKGTRDAVATFMFAMSRTSSTLPVLPVEMILAILSSGPI